MSDNEYDSLEEELSERGRTLAKKDHPASTEYIVVLDGKYYRVHEDVELVRELTASEAQSLISEWEHGQN